MRESLDFLGHRIGLIEVSKEDRNMTDTRRKLLLMGLW